MSLISKAEYARRRGVSGAAVTRAIKDGRITTTADGRIDPELADEQWSRNTRSRGAPRSAASAEPAPAAAVEPSSPEQPKPRRELGEFDEARTRREKAQADLAELELAVKRGELVRAEDVERALAGNLIAVREALDALADRLSAAITPEMTQADKHRLIRQEHRAALSVFAEAKKAAAEEAEA